MDSVRRDNMGNLICVKNGTDPNGKRIMLSAHMDHIGFIVAAVEKEGFLRVAPVGGINPAVSQTRHVSFENGVQGVLVRQPLKEGETVAMKHFYIDIGAKDAEEALSMVQVGDVAVYANDCFRLGAASGGRAPPWTTGWPARCWSACSAICLLCKDTVFAVFSTQEELGLPRRKDSRLRRGAGRGHCAGRDRQRRHARGQAARREAGRGHLRSRSWIGAAFPTRSWFGSCWLPAKKRACPLSGKCSPSAALTREPCSLTRGGVRVCTLSIPCRNVHSACEVIDLRDVDGGKKLLLAYLER